MDSDSEKENYFSLYMKRKKNDSKKKSNFRSNKKIKNNCISNQKLKEDNKNNIKLFLESSEKKNKNAFSFIKSHLFNFQSPEKIKKETELPNKNGSIDKQKIKAVKGKRSSADITYRKNNKKYSDGKVLCDAMNDKNNSIDLNYNSNNNYDKKIDILQNRIFNLMNVIDNFEKDYINNNKPIQIKEQLNKINFKIISNNIQINKDNKNINEPLYMTERVNYNQNRKLKNTNKKDYIKLKEDLEICNYDNNILTKRINTSKKSYRAVSSKASDKNKSIILLNHKQYSNKYNNSSFIKLLSNSSSKNELNKTYYNANKNKAPTFIKQINSNSNNVFQNEKDKKESSIFKRRINYSNFINQKMKQNIVHRNQESYLKQNAINKSRYSYNNSNNSNGCPAQLAINNYYNPDLFINNNNKSTSIENKIIKINDLNYILNEKEIQSDKIRNKIRMRYFHYSNEHITQKLDRILNNGNSYLDIENTQNNGIDKANDIIASGNNKIIKMFGDDGTNKIIVTIIQFYDNENNRMENDGIDHRGGRILCLFKQRPV